MVDISNGNPTFRLVFPLTWGETRPLAGRRQGAIARHIQGRSTGAPRGYTGSVQVPTPTIQGVAFFGDPSVTKVVRSSSGTLSGLNRTDAV